MRLHVEPSSRTALTAALLIAGFLAATLAAPPAFAQANSITGGIFDTNRRAVGDLWVELLDEVNTILTRTRADSNGRYSFRGLSTGVFQVRVVTFGTPYAPQTVRVELIQALAVGGGRAFTEHVDIYLKPLEGTTPGPVPGTVFAQEVPETARKAYEDAVAILDQGKDVEAGLARLKEALDTFPEYFLALERTGVELVRLGRHEPALPVLAKAIQVNPNGHDSLYALGVAQYRLRKYTESASTLRRMISVAPMSANASFAHYFLGLALVRAGKPGEAEPELKKAYGHGDNKIPSDVHMALAQIYSNDKRYKDAIAELELFLKETPDARDAEKIRAIISQLRSKAR